MLHEGKIWVGSGVNGPVSLLPAMANRHGLIAGATGTGKTVSLKVLAEGFSDLGVPVFLSDIKSDLSGMVRSGTASDAIEKRLKLCGVPEGGFSYHAYPTKFWDVYGEEGEPILATVRDMGPLLLSRMLRLNETQSGVLNILFRYCNEYGYELNTLQDLQARLIVMGENAREFTLKYGNVSVASVGAIQRAVSMLEDQGGSRFFRAPTLDIISQWMKQEEQTGRGQINILAADRLFNHPVMYSTFLMWMLTELYDVLPERGDRERPLMVFFFDEAHLLFDDCSRTLMDKIEQIVRLVRSKGVGVYFITQSPSDIPMPILGQLGNRIQHALRAYTPLDQKAVRVAAQTFRTNPGFNTEEVITELKTGEALVSFLDEHGAPGIVERVTVLPPQSHMGAISAEERALARKQGYLEDPEKPAGTEPENPVPKAEDVPAAPAPAAAETPAQPEEKADPVPVLPYEPGPVPEPRKETEVPVLVVEPPAEAAPVTQEGSISPELAALEEMCAALSVPLDAPIPPSTEAGTVESPTTPQRTRVSAAKKKMSQTFKVFDPTTGEYVTQELPQMTTPEPAQPAYAPQPAAQQPVVQQPVYQQPVVQQPVYQQPVVQQPVAPQPVFAPQPVVQAAPEAQVPTIQVQPAVQQMPVMVYDAATGQYVQQMMTMQQDPATGNWIPFQQPQITTDPIALAEQQKLAEKARRDAEKAAKEAEKAAKEQEAADRRARNDALREEAAERARRNDSIVGRIKNTAISTATRQVTSSLTKGITNAISELFGGKKR